MTFSLSEITLAYVHCTSSTVDIYLLAHYPYPLSIIPSYIAHYPVKCNSRIHIFFNLKINIL